MWLSLHIKLLFISNYECLSLCFRLCIYPSTAPFSYSISLSTSAPDRHFHLACVPFLSVSLWLHTNLAVCSTMAPHNHITSLSFPSSPLPPLSNHRPMRHTSASSVIPPSPQPAPSTPPRRGVTSRPGLVLYPPTLKLPADTWCVAVLLSLLWHLTRYIKRWTDITFTATCFM